MPGLASFAREVEKKLLTEEKATELGEDEEAAVEEGGVLLGVDGVGIGWPLFLEKSRPEFRDCGRGDTGERGEGGRRSGERWAWLRGEFTGELRGELREGISEESFRKSFVSTLSPAEKKTYININYFK